MQAQQQLRPLNRHRICKILQTDGASHFPTPAKLASPSQASESESQLCFQGGRAMAAARDLAGSFQDEVTCSICLEYFTDPVTIECGHNCCRACISRCWGESETNFPCPQCRKPAQQRHLRPNKQLGNLVELVKCLRGQAVPGLLKKVHLSTTPLGVTLDPDTAHPNLVLSEDRKRARQGHTCQDLPDNPERFDTYLEVLGAEGFTGGRRYWEVEVGNKPEWDLGVCRDSVSRKGKITLTPGNGYWVMRLSNGKYSACTAPLTPLPVSIKPSRVGIFLDYEAGEVSFYNVTDRSRVFTFTDTFSGTLRPYFYTGYNKGNRNVAPLIICPVPAQTE
uniref:E3 ubiquitin-protein ligase TRIM39-like n=1 Tax=Pelusios castaneus TaxID=367368 RepID=A0A8C8RNF7_9SAUR